MQVLRTPAEAAAWLRARGSACIVDESYEKLVFDGQHGGAFVFVMGVQMTAHQRLFVRDDTEFNESYAQFVEQDRVLHRERLRAFAVRVDARDDPLEPVVVDPASGDTTFIPISADTGRFQGQYTLAGGVRRGATARRPARPPTSGGPRPGARTARRRSGAARCRRPWTWPGG